MLRMIDRCKVPPFPAGYGTRSVEVSCFGYTVAKFQYDHLSSFESSASYMQPHTLVPQQRRGFMLRVIDRCKVPHFLGSKVHKLQETTLIGTPN
jgi:hypothetical protein